MSGTGLWVVLGVLVLLAIVAVAYFATRKQKDARRNKAKSLRKDATSHAESVREREADAKAARRSAEQAQVEADAQAAEAEKLRERAQHEDKTVAESREEVHERLQQADKIDPDTDHRRS